MMKTKQNARWTLLGLLLIFILPMLLAWYTYLHPSLFKGQTNYGRLINPLLQFSELTLYHQQGGESSIKQALKAKWAILYVDASPCQTACRQNIYKMRQVHTALGKEHGRVNTVVILMADKPLNNEAQPEMLAHDFPGSLYAVARSKDLNAFFSTANANSAKGFYLIDPLGNIMLSYLTDTNPDHLYKDLKHLLKISQIG